MDEIILFGAGGHARACVDVIELGGKFAVAGFIEKSETNIQRTLGYPVLGTDDDLQSLRGKYNHALIAVGQIQSAAIRVRLFQALQQMDYMLPVIVSPKAYVSKHAQIGAGTIVMHGAIINANARVGTNCIINNRALVDHDAEIGDHSHIATGAIINGEVSVGQASFIGSGVVTKQCLSIGSNCIVGAGVVLKNDMAPNQVIKN